jgi:hypothetical protein
MRNFGISLLFLALLAAGYEGFRDRERGRPNAPNATTTVEDGTVHTQEGGMIMPPVNR